MNNKLIEDLTVIKQALDQAVKIGLCHNLETAKKIILSFESVVEYIKTTEQTNKTD